jgi:hypothetical protein
MAAGIRATWAAADEVYGRCGEFRAALRSLGLSYVVIIPCDYRVTLAKNTVIRADQAIARAVFERRSCGNGTKGPRYGGWALLATADPREFLLIRRLDRQENQYTFYLCQSPEGRPATMTYFITIAGRRWLAETTFRTGKDALGWDQSQARTYDAICRHTALTALAQLRTAAIQAALAGCAGILRAAPAASQDTPGTTDLATVNADDLQVYTGGAPLPRPRRPALPARHPPDRAIRRRNRPHRTPRPRLESRNPQPRPPRLPSPLVSMAQAAPGPRPLAPLRRPPGHPRHLTSDGPKEVTTCNHRARTTSNTQPQRGHRPENSDCNTGHRHTPAVKPGTVQRFSRHPRPAFLTRESSGLTMWPWVSGIHSEASCLQRPSPWEHRTVLCLPFPGFHLGAACPGRSPATATPQPSVQAAHKPS